MKLITPEELKNLMDSGQETLLVDVREPYEHTEFNIGGLEIPLGRFHSMDVDELDEYKNKEIILYCRSGNRSGQACLILDSLGFEHTFNLQGGMLAWRDKFGG